MTKTEIRYHIKSARRLIKGEFTKETARDWIQYLECAADELSLAAFLIRQWLIDNNKKNG